MRISLKRFLSLLWLSSLGLLLVIGSLLGGCGEKIAIPLPEGEWGLNPYYWQDSWTDMGLSQVYASRNRLYVLYDNVLVRRDWDYGYIRESAEVLSDARSLCADEGDSIIFVWDQGSQRVSWFGAQELELRGTAVLPEVQTAVSMVTCTAGIEKVPGASTFLYLADPDSGVVHRYAYDEFVGLSPFGILTDHNGNGARFVHVAAGMARDSADSLLVCDIDPARNWVIRFNADPDLTDTGDPDLLRGWAALFDFPTCQPPAAADYVLGDAAACGESDWVGGPSDLVGEFHRPEAVAVDGSGRIFVSDTNNNRLQIFSATGDFDVAYGDSLRVPQPASMAVIDDRWGEGEEAIDYAAFLFVITGDGTEVRKYVSDAWLQRENQEPPPEDYD